MADTLSAFKVVATNDVEKLIYLIRDDLDPNLKDQGLATALESESREDVVECFTSLGMPRSAVYLDLFRGKTLAMIASEKGHAEVLQVLIESHADILRLDDNRRSALSYASANGHTQCVRILLQHGAAVNEVSGSGMTALMYASKSHNAEVVMMLLDSGAELDAVGSLGVTSLMWAADGGDVQVVRTLVDAGADIEKTDGNGKTALMYACDSGSIPVMEFLLRSGANVHQLDRYGKTTLMSAAQVGSVGGIRLLTEHGANIHSVDSDGRSPLLFAVLASSLPCVEALLNLGANINGQDFKGKTAVVHCIENNFHEILRFLLCRGADANLQDSSKKTPLMYAIEFHCKYCLTLLQEYFSSSVDAEDEKGATALMYSIKVNSFHALKFLIDFGANIYLRNAKGLTPVMICAAENNAEFLEYLLGSCSKHQRPVSPSNPTITSILEDVDFRGRTALMHAAIHDSSDTLRILLELGARLDARDEEGNTAMMLASAFGSAQALLIFLSVPSIPTPNPNLHNAFGETALMLAAQSGRQECVELLVKTSNVNLDDAQGTTALMFASLAHSVKCVEVLLNANCSVDAVNSSGSTALMLALDKAKHRDVPFYDPGAMERKMQCLGLLLSKGANVNACRFDGKNAIQLALGNCKSEQEASIGLKLLRECSVFPDVSVVEGPVFLRFIFQGNFKLVKLLVELGMSPADADFILPPDAKKPGRKWSPLAVAVACGHVEIVEFFLDIWFTTRYDVTALFTDDHVRTAISLSPWSNCDKEKTLSLVEEVFSEPLSLFQLAHTAVNSTLCDSVAGSDVTSKAVGQCSRRAYALQMSGLPVPLQRKLLFGAKPLSDLDLSTHTFRVTDAQGEAEGASILNDETAESEENSDAEYGDLDDFIKRIPVRVSFECAGPDGDEEKDILKTVEADVNIESPDCEGRRGTEAKNERKVTEKGRADGTAEKSDVKVEVNTSAFSDDSGADKSCQLKHVDVDSEDVYCSDAEDRKFKGEDDGERTTEERIDDVVFSRPVDIGVDQANSAYKPDPMEIPGVDDVSDRTSRRPFSDDVSDRTSRRPFSDDVLDRTSRRPFIDDVLYRTSRRPFSDDVSDRTSRRPFSDDVSDRTSRRPFSDDVSDRTSRRPFSDDVSDRTSRRPFSDDVGHFQPACPEASSQTTQPLSRFASKTQPSFHGDRQLLSGMSKNEKKADRMGDGAGDFSGVRTTQPISKPSRFFSVNFYFLIPPALLCLLASRYRFSGAYSTALSTERKWPMSSVHVVQTFNFIDHIIYAIGDVDNVILSVAAAHLYSNRPVGTTEKKQKHNAGAWSRGMSQVICAEEKVREFCSGSKRSTCILGKGNKMVEFGAEILCLGGDIRADVLLTKLKHENSRSEYSSKAVQHSGRTSRNRRTACLYNGRTSRNRRTASLYSGRTSRNRRTACLYSGTTSRNRRTAGLYSGRTSRNRRTACLYSGRTSRNRRTACLYSGTTSRNSSTPPIECCRTPSQNSSTFLQNSSGAFGDNSTTAQYVICRHVSTRHFRPAAVSSRCQKLLRAWKKVARRTTEKNASRELGLGLGSGLGNRSVTCPSCLSSISNHVCAAGHWQVWAGCIASGLLSGTGVAVPAAGYALFYALSAGLVSPIPPLLLHVLTVLFLLSLLFLLFSSVSLRCTGVRCSVPSFSRLISNVGLSSCIFTG